MTGRVLRKSTIVLIPFAALLVAGGTAWGQRQDPTSLGLTKKFAIEVTNPGPGSLDNWPVVLDVAEIRKSFPDFNISSYAIFEETGSEFIIAVPKRPPPDSAGTRPNRFSAGNPISAPIPSSTERSNFSPSSIPF
jgi:hypothetical protein